MKHSFLDKYSDLNSPVHRLDPRAKIISLFLYIIFVVTTPPADFRQFLIYFLVIFTVISASSVPLFYVLKRSLIVIPFVLLVAVFLPFLKKDPAGHGYSLGLFRLTVSSGGLWMLWNVFVKSYLAVLAMVTLSSTTKFSMLLKGLELLGMPKVLIMILSFMYRYVFVLVDEAMRMEQARSSRYFGGRYLRQVKVLGNIIGLLFIRAYERGERVYQGMVSRGFDGDIKTMNRLTISVQDVCFCAVFLAGLAAVKTWSLL